MSTFKVCPTTCASCGHAFEVEVAFGIDRHRDVQDVRTRVLAGTFQVLPCPACAATAIYESPMVHIDFPRGEYVALETARSATKQTAIARHETIYRNGVEAGPAIAQEIGARLRRRIVFGLPAMREKLVLWDAGLDDRIVEAVKGDLLEAEDYHPAAVMLRLIEILDGGHLLFGAYPPIDPPEGMALDQPWSIEPTQPIETLIGTAAMYEARAAAPSKVERDFPWLAEEWIVDMHDGPSYLYR